MIPTVPRLYVARFAITLWILCLPFCGGCRLVRGPGRSVPVGAPPGPNHAATAGPAVRFTDVTARAGIRFEQQSSKTARKYLIETFGSGCAFIDYDGDGWQDVLLLNNTRIPGGRVTGRPNMALYHNNRNGTFTDVTHKAGLDIAG